MNIRSLVAVSALLLAAISPMSVSATTYVYNVDTSLVFPSATGTITTDCNNCILTPSVLILKLSYSLLLKADRPTTKAFNRSENVVGWFGPSERLWIGVSGLDVRVDRALEFGR